MAQRLKRLPAMQETWVRSLGREDPLEKEMGTHSSVLGWRIPWTEEPGELHSTHGLAKSQTRLSDFTSLQTEFQSQLPWQGDLARHMRFENLLSHGIWEAWEVIKGISRC